MSRRVRCPTASSSAPSSTTSGPPTIVEQLSVTAGVAADEADVPRLDDPAIVDCLREGLVGAVGEGNTVEVGEQSAGHRAGRRHGDGRPLRRHERRQRAGRHLRLPARCSGAGRSAWAFCPGSTPRPPPPLTMSSPSSTDPLAAAEPRLVLRRSDRNKLAMLGETPNDTELTWITQRAFAWTALDDVGRVGSRSGAIGPNAPSVQRQKAP